MISLFDTQAFFSTFNREASCFPVECFFGVNLNENAEDAAELASADGEGSSLSESPHRTTLSLSAALGSIAEPKARRSRA